MTTRIDAIDAGSRNALLRRWQSARGASRDAIRRKDDMTPAPLSFGQRRVWLASQCDTTGIGHNVSLMLRLSGSLSATAFESSFARVIERHDGLRTIVATQRGEPVQIVGSEAIRLDRATDRGDGSAPAARHASAPFDLSRGPLCRGILVESEDGGDALFALTLHHLIVDGWSLGNFLRELSEGYSADVLGRPAVLPELTMRYVDFAEWEQETFRRPEIGEQIAQLAGQFADAPPPLVLGHGATRPGPAAAGRQSRCLDADVSRAIQALVQDRRVTLFSLVLATLGAAIAVECDVDDLVVAVDVANRGRPEFEPLIGFFVNIVPIRLRPARTSTLARTLDEAHAAAVTAFQRAEIPFELLVEPLRLPSWKGRTPFLQVVLAMQEDTASAISLTGMTARIAQPDLAVCRFDLGLAVTRRAGGLIVSWTFNKAAIDAQLVESLSDNFVRLITAAATNVDATIAMAVGRRHAGVTEESI